MPKEYIYHRKLNDENINKLLIDLELESPLVKGIVARERAP